MIDKLTLEEIKAGGPIESTDFGLEETLAAYRAGYLWEAWTSRSTPALFGLKREATAAAYWEDGQRGDVQPIDEVVACIVMGIWPVQADAPVNYEAFEGMTIADVALATRLTQRALDREAQSS